MSARVDSEQTGPILVGMVKTPVMTRVLLAMFVAVAVTSALTSTKAYGGAPPPTSGPAPTAGGPEATLRAYNEKLDKVLKGGGGGGEKVDRATVKALAADLFDYNELAKRALAQHWDKLARPQQDEFVRTFSEMLEKNYVKELRTNLDYDVIYKNESVTDDGATVATIVKVRTKGKSTDVSIDYKLRKADGKWKVYDVITDEVGMVQNYRKQFNKVITTQSYDALLKKMKQKTAEAEAPARSDAPGSKPAVAPAPVAAEPAAAPKKGGKKPAPSK